ncbi:MAG TPA: GNAT family N-acetyltransferase [Pirellulales bacterium]
MTSPAKEVDMQRLHAAQFARARALLGRAFYDYNLMVHAQPKDHRRLGAVETLYGAMLWDCLCRGETHVTPDFTGVSAWLAPGTGLPSFLQQVRCGMLRLPLGFGARGFRRLLAYDEVGRRLHHQYAAEPHWYLAVIAVDVGQQGRGIGSDLMRPMLARADAEGKACWLDTHQEQNVRLYKRHGFEIAECAEVRGHPIPVYGMLRRPR